MNDGMEGEKEAIYHDPRLVDFYDLENGWAADFALCRDIARTGRSVLDLGCGTGILATALAAEGLSVTGVDPAPAMLARARARPGGEAVRWHEGDARDLRLAQEFDLVLLTGHAFQVFLTREDRAAVLATVAAHLAPGGRFLFDSRNPVAGSWHRWTPDRSRRRLNHPDHGPVDCWNDVAWDPARAIATYDTFYRLPDGEVLSARARIAFPARSEIAQAIAGAGLSVDRWMGDWHGTDWHEDSAEIIPLGRRG